MGNNRKINKKYLFIIALLILVGIFFYISRITNISNELKKIILPELELALGKKVTIQKISINVIPIFLEINNLAVYDDEGNKFFTVKRAKSYISILGILKREIIIKRLVIKDPFLNIDKKEANLIIKNLKNYLSQETKIPFKLKIKSINTADGDIEIKDPDFKIHATELNSEILLADIPRIRISSKMIFTKNDRDYPFLLETNFLLKEDIADIKYINLFYDGSKTKFEGKLGIERLDGEFKTEISLLVNSFKNIFKLKNKGDGKILASGRIKTEDLSEGFGKFFIDLKLKGDLYLETLMEFLNIKEDLSGYLSFNGKVNGFLNDLNGNAKTNLRKGILFGVEVDDLNCDVLYNKRQMSFLNGVSRLYNGIGYAEAVINLPILDFYSIKVAVKNVDSKGLFKLIKWDPGIPKGKVSGGFVSSGSRFNPSGEFVYKNTSHGKNIVERIKDIEGTFSLKENNINFSKITIKTDKSNLYSQGNVNLSKKEINFIGNAISSDIQELTYPYFLALSGPVNFDFQITGMSEDPIIDIRYSSDNMKLEASELSFSDLFNRVLYINKVEGDLSYRRNLLIIKKGLLISNKSEHIVSGRIYFPQSAHLFDLRNPEFDITTFSKNFNIELVTKNIKKIPSLRGFLDSKFIFRGKPEDLKISGNFLVQKVDVLFPKVGHLKIDKMDGNMEFQKNKFIFDSLNIIREDSKINAKGFISLNKEFSFFANSDRTRVIHFLPDKLISDPNQLEVLGNIFLKEILFKGEGFLDNPKIEIQSEINGGEYKGVKLGKGELKGIVANKKMSLNLSLLDNKLAIKGRASLTEMFPWTAEINMYPARYDFLITRFLKDIPEDLLLNLSGKITASGDKDNINAFINLNKVHLYLYELGFSNSTDVLATLNNRKLSINSLSMKSDNAEFSIKGFLDLNKKYDIVISGSSSLTPIKAISRNIDIIKGNSSFVFLITGDWVKPKISGGIDINNGVLGFKNITYRIIGISAYIYVEDNKIVIENAKGKVSGGDISVVGLAYLDGLSVRNFFLESKVNNISASLSKDFWAIISGNLYYRGTKDSQSLLGDLQLKKAKYSERVEWKSWLLKAKQKERQRGELSKIEQINLNLKLYGSDLIIDNNLAKLSVKIDVVVRGTIGQPIVLGKADFDEGIVYFRNNEFKILKGKIDFSNPTKTVPYFDISATTNVKNYDIRLNLDGYIEQFNLSLLSNPPLDETDILSLLTVGQIGKQLKGFEGGIGTSEVTAFLTGKMQDVFEERLKTITGFDRIQIDPYVSHSTGTVMPRLTVSKRLLGDKLYVTYSTPMGSTEEQILKLEYNLEKNMSIVGFRDEKGGIGGDIRFKFQFK